jgi:hypothetical protein
VELAAGRVLESTPVYTLPDRSLKESAARYFLREVAVRGGKLHVTLSAPPDALSGFAQPETGRWMALGAMVVVGLLGLRLLRRRKR